MRGRLRSRRAKVVRSLERFVTRPLWRWSCILTLATSTLATGFAAAAEYSAEELLARDPFDVLVVLDKGQPRDFEIEPLVWPAGKTAADMDAGAVVRVTLLSRPEEQYDITWRHVSRLIRHGDLLQAAARRLAEEKRFDESFRLYEHIRELYTAMPGLEENLAQTILLEAAHAYRVEDLDRALLTIDAGLAIDPKDAKLLTALGRVAQRLLDTWTREGEYAAAHQLLEKLEAHRCDQIDPVITTWQERYAAQARRIAGESLAAGRAGRFRDAYFLAHQAARVWPAQTEAQAAVRSAESQHLPLRVGVTEPFHATDLTLAFSGPYASEPGRRVAPLLVRPIVTVTDFGSNGAQFSLVGGELTSAPDRRSVTLAFSDGATEHMPEAQDRAAAFLREMIALGRGREPGRESPFSWIAVDGASRVSLGLTRTYANPPIVLRQEGLESLNATRNLAVELEAAGSSIPPHPLWTGGPFRPAAAPGSFPGASSFVRAVSAETVEGYASEILELPFESTVEALRALRDGNIDAVDRLHPADAAALLQPGKDDPAVRVGRLRMPEVHCLLCSGQRPLMRSGSFRRALLSALPRQEMLETLLLEGQRETEATVVSGPFPAPSSATDVRGYAYDDRVAPRKSDPALAAALLKLGSKEAGGLLTAALWANGVAGVTPSGGAWMAMRSAASAPIGRGKVSVVISHPPAEVPRLVCQAIARRYETLGLAVAVHEEPWSAARKGGWDLRYARLAWEDPLADADAFLRTLAEPPINDATANALRREIAQARDLEAARRALRAAHRTLHGSLPILPLWQVPRSFAVAPGWAPASEPRMQFYQGAEHWRREAVTP